MNDFDARRNDSNLSEMASRIGSAIRVEGAQEVFPSIWLNRLSHCRESVFGESTPAICFIAQGAKEVFVGDHCYRYDPAHYLLATIELPVRSIAHTATVERPYLGIRIDVDPALVASVMVEAGITAIHGQADAKALSVSPVDPDLLDAATRLVRLLGSPAQANVLVPQVKREIVYRVLMGDQGHRLRQLPAPGGHAQRIAQALDKLKESFDQPLSIEALAHDLGMSSTRFHHHFKAVTDMSPLQYQKQLRLQEARKLMLNEDLDAASAGYRVGYEDPSHFSRDYKKHFGHPPAQDAERLRTMAVSR